MTLPIPDIDDRKFDDILDEAISLLPRYNREWTNFNPSDPGIALLELFAWLTETAVYRANLIPEDSSWKFLELVGIKKKRETRFTEELLSGDRIVAEGQIKIVKEIGSGHSLSIDRAFEPDIYRSSFFASVRPEVYSGDVAVEEIDTTQGGTKEQGMYKFSVNGTGGGFAALMPGYVVIAGQETGMVRTVTGDSGNEMKVHFPFSSGPAASNGFLWLKTQPCQGKVRARGKHLLGEETVFSELEEGDIIAARSQLRVVSDIKSDRLLTVHVPFDLDIDDAESFYFIRPGRRSGTILSDGFMVEGNREDETLESAIFRAAEYVSDNYRAVTTEDYEMLAAKALTGICENFDFRIVCRNNRNFEWQGMGSERAGHVSLFIIARYEQGYLYKRKTGLNDLVRIVVDGSDRKLDSREIRDKLREKFEEVFEHHIAAGFNAATGAGAVKTAVDGAKEILKKCIDEAEELNDPEGKEIDLDDKNMGAAIENGYFDVALGKVLERVEAFLDPRRLLTTRVHAVYPRFREFAIDASLLIMKGVDEETLKKEAAEKLKLFFDPLKGGPDGSGWPLGRNLYRSEVYQALEGVRGVDHVLSLAIKKDYGKDIVELYEDELIELDCTIELERG